MSRQLLLLLVVLPTLPALGQEWDDPTEETQKLIASDGAEDDRYGQAVAVLGDFILVGAYLDDEEEGTGSAYLLCFDSETQEWVEEHQIVSPSGGGFGRSVSADEAAIMIGAPWVTGGGAAYVFRYDEDSSEWEQEQELTASDQETGELFGYSVSLSGNIAVAGAHRDREDGDLLGSAYVFRYDEDDGEWTEEQKLVASDAGPNDYFGYSVSAHADVILVGSYGWDGDGQARGAAYVFRYDTDDEEWVEEQILEASDADDYELFGMAVALADGVAVVGAERDDDDTDVDLLDAGAAYIFRYDEDETEWNEEQKLTASDIARADYFGNSVAIDGDTVVVGAHKNDDNGTNSGSAYVFRFNDDDGEWSEALKLHASDGSAMDKLAVSSGVSGQTVVLGSFRIMSNNTNAGSAYVYDLTPFLRGDVDGDSAVSWLVDSLYLLEWSFTGGDDPPCMDAADVDDSGVVSGLVDALSLLLFGFADGSAPPAPGVEDCGVDLTVDGLYCLESPDECL